MKTIGDLVDELQRGVHEMEQKQVVSRTVSDIHTASMRAIPPPPKPPRCNKQVPLTPIDSSDWFAFINHRDGSSDVMSKLMECPSADVILSAQIVPTATEYPMDDSTVSPLTDDGRVPPLHLQRPFNRNGESSCFFQVQMFAMIWTFKLTAFKAFTTFYYIDNITRTKRMIKLNEQLVMSHNAHSAKAIAVDGGVKERSVYLTGPLFKLSKNSTRNFALTEDNLVVSNGSEGDVNEHLNVHSYGWKNYKLV